MSTSYPSSAKRPKVRLERDINTDETANHSEENTHPFFASDTVEIYRRQGRTSAEIDEDRDGSHQKRQSRKRRSQSPSHGMSNKRSNNSFFYFSFW